jgi:PAS domain S-box-containing protein
MARLRQAVEAAVAEGTPYELELRAIRKDGETRVCVARGVAEMSPGGRAVRLCGSLQDITERKRAEETLRESEERFRLAVLATFNAVWDWNLRTDALWWSENFQTLFGYRAEEIEPGIESWTNRIHPEDLDRVRAGIHAAIDSGRQYWSDQYRVRRKDGSYAVVDDRGYITRTANGVPVRMIGAMQDITERKRAEEALARTSGELNTVLDATADGILVVDQAGRVLLANARFREMWRIPEAVAAPRDDGALLDFVLDQLVDPEGFMAKVRSLYRQDVEDWDTLAFKDGRVFERFSCPLIEGGRPVARLWSFADITERKRAEEALRESEERHRSIIEQLNDVYYRTDRDGRITMMSPSAAHLFGFPSTSEMIGRPIESLWADPGQRAALLAAISERGFVRDYETTAVRTDGTAFAVAVSSHYVRDASGAADGVEGIIRDITERKQSEEALRALARHLDSVREEEHTRIARQIHDELGQALTALRLDLTWVGRKIPKRNTALRRRIDAAVALTDETITVGQRIVGELRPPILDDLGLVPAVEWFAQHFAKRSGLRIEFDIGAEEPVVPDQLAITAYRIVQEALTNVARHAQATHARVRLGEQDGALTIEIRDDGRGLPEEALRSPHSFGIVGMRERAASHGGELAITSSPGAGTTVRVTFPLDRREEPLVPR